MRAFLITLIFLPIVLLGSVFAWVAGSQPEPVQTSIQLPAIGTPPKTDDAKVRKGWDVFTQKGCVYCHGPNASGGVANPNAQGGLVPALEKVYEGFSEDELKKKIRVGVQSVGKKDPAGPAPPLNMPAWKGALSSSELDAVVAYLMSFAPEDGGEDEW